MSEFKITREIVRELAETGGVQLTGSADLPSASDFADEEITRALESGVMLPGEFDEEDIKKRAVKAAAMRAMNAAAPIICMAAEAIYGMSLGDLPIECIRDLSIRERTSANNPFTVLRPGDANVLNCHRDNGNKISGFSIIWSLLSVPKEELVVAGRGVRPSSHHLARYKYKRGPVVIAQRGFGSLLVGEENARSATWHRGQRSDLGIIAICDAEYDEQIVIEDAKLRLKINGNTKRV